MLMTKRRKPRSLPTIRLRRSEQARLKAMTSRGREPARVVKRARVLQLLHNGLSARQASIAAAVGVGTVHRVANRYCNGGLTLALYEKTRPGGKRLLATRQETALVAMVCSAPPPGRARWTVRLVAKEAVTRKVVATVGRETIRRMLAHHELKPWREKNVVRANTR
jgi:putative transposase